MTTKDYNVFLDNDKGNLRDCYKKFSKEYIKNLREIENSYMIFDINNVAAILKILNKEELKSQIENNLTLIGIDRSINKTIQEIKSKGFSLERKL